MHSCKLFKILTLFAVSVCGLTMFSACQGRTAENMEPSGDTVEVKVNHPVEKADTVLQSLDDEFIHGLDNETVMATRI